MAAGTIVQAFIAIEFWFESQMQWKFTVYAKTSAFLLLSIVKIGLILLKAPLIAFAWAGLADTALGSVGLANRLSEERRLFDQGLALQPGHWQDHC